MTDKARTEYGASGGGKEATAAAKRFFNAFDRVIEGQPQPIRALTEAAGFEVIHTGGGCVAYGASWKSINVMLTDVGGVDLPKAPDEACIFGTEGPEGEWLNTDDQSSLTASEFLSVWRTLAEQAVRYFKAGFRQDLAPIGPWLEEAIASGAVHPDEAAAAEKIAARCRPAPTP